MIPLGLKETKEIDFREPFKDFVLEHYSEDGHDYENAIAGECSNRMMNGNYAQHTLATFFVTILFDHLITRNKRNYR